MRLVDMDLEDLIQHVKNRGLRQSLKNYNFYIVRFQKLWSFFFEKNVTFPIIVASISKMDYFKNKRISKNCPFSKIGLFQKWAYFKK